MGTDLLQIILLGNVFLLGIIVTIAIRRLLDHNKPQHHSGVLSDQMKDELSQAAREQFMVALESSGAALKNDMNTTGKQLTRLSEQFGTEILNDEMQRFRTNLEAIRRKTEAETGNTHGQIAAHQNELEMELAKRRGELEKRVTEHQAQFEQSIASLQTQIEQSLAERQSAFTAKLAERESALEGKLDAELAAEREKLLRQIDTKLGDAVGSFLIETLGTNVDLGAQTPYLLGLLEEHKDDFKREIHDGNKPQSAA